MIMEAKSTLFAAKQTVVKANVKATGAVVDSAAGVPKTASALPFPANIPLIIGYVAQAIGIIGAVKSAVKSTKQAAASVGASVGGGDIQTPAASIGAAASTPPDLTSVSGTGENQLANVIAGQNQQPIQTFVVASEVTTAQSLERNIVDGATL